MRSLIAMPLHRANLAAPAFVARTVVAMQGLMQLASAVREFISPFFKPDLHYIRRARPAYARRVESRQVLPVLKGRGIGRSWGAPPVQRQLLGERHER
ncbi:hypothetical protein [Mesorhizobium sp. 43Arga]